MTPYGSPLKEWTRYEGRRLTLLLSQLGDESGGQSEEAVLERVDDGAQENLSVVDDEVEEGSHVGSPFGFG